MTRELVEKLSVALFIAGIVGLANLALKAERMDERIRQLERRQDYFHGEAGK